MWYPILHSPVFVREPDSLTRFSFALLIVDLQGSLRTDVSWKVACGANVAYDQFPSQNQIFYESVNGRDMWYDPVFRVETLDGRHVWCKRPYKVRDLSRIPI